MKTYNIKDYYVVTGLRHSDISDDSGEDFYIDHLNSWFKNAFEKNVKILIDLDETSGYAPSFLDEAFGNLVFDFGIENVSRLLALKSEQEPHWIEMLEKETYPQWETRRIKNDKPKKSRKGVSWFKIQDGLLINLQI